MSSEKQNFLLYQLSPLKKLEEIKLKELGKREKYIESLFSDSLESIFPDLIPLKQQCYLKHPVEEKNCIIDSLAFNKKDNSFLIIEFKREKAAELVYQVAEYMECLEDESDRAVLRNRHKLLRLLDDNEALKKKRKNNYWEEEEINWNETKAICIITDIHGYQKTLLRSKKEDGKIKLIKIAFYQENILYIDIEKVAGWLKIGSQIIRNNSSEEKPITNIFENEGQIDQEAEESLAEVEKCIFSLGWCLEKKEWIKEGYAPRFRYYNKDTNKALVSLIIRTKKINVYWNFKSPHEISQNLKNLMEKYNILYKREQHGVIGSWFFPSVSNKISLQNLKEFILEYKNYCGDEPKTD